MKNRLYVNMEKGLVFNLAETETGKVIGMTGGSAVIEQCEFDVVKIGNKYYRPLKTEELVVLQEMEEVTDETRI